MPKKITKFILIAFTLLFAFLPRLTLAAEGGAAEEVPPPPVFDAGQTPGTTPEKTGIQGVHDALKDSQVVGTDNVRDLVIKYVNFALPLLALAAFLGFVYAGFLYVTAFGVEDQVGKAKKVITYAVIGLVLVILSYSIVQLLTVGLVTGINK